MNYFEHPFVSNSDLKSFKKRIGGDNYEEPINLKQIFSFGSLFHRVILEPNTITEEDKANPDYQLAKKMGITYFTDPICRMIILGKDFEREHEFYEEVEVGGMRFKGRCKADGFRKGISCYLELKGLGVASENAFKEALVRFDYDQAVVHYMLTAHVDKCLIVGISKKDPRLMFKKMVKQYDEFYLNGEQKLIDVLKLLQQYSPEDVINV